MPEVKVVFEASREFGSALPDQALTPLILTTRADPAVRFCGVSRALGNTSLARHLRIRPEIRISAGLAARVTTRFAR